MPCSVVVFSVKKKEKISTADFPYERYVIEPVQDGNNNKRIIGNIFFMCPKLILSCPISGEI